MNPDLKSGADAPRSSCGLLPPCKDGYHCVSVSRKGEKHSVKPIGKYYFSEDALKHDLAALKRGEVYERDDFYRRAKAWYKAEIDRLLHLEKVKMATKESSSEARGTAPTNEPSMIEPSNTQESTLAPSDAPSPAPSRSRRRACTALTPTRIQPARAAKRKAAADPPQTSQQMKKPNKAQEALVQLQVQPQPQPCPVPTETIGDYTLAEHDWQQFLNHKQGEHRPSQWSYVQLQGLDAAYFAMRLERAVRAKIGELLLRPSQQPAQQSNADVDGEVVRVDTGHGAGMDAEWEGERQSCSRDIGKLTLRCGLDAGGGAPGLKTWLNLQSLAPFTPAAALSSGEDWRPPDCDTETEYRVWGGVSGIRGSTPGKDGGSPCLTVGFWAPDEVNRREGKNKTPTASLWAADEVNRREGKLNKTPASSRSQSQVPEAEMEISPTLGRWSAFKGGPPVEDLAGNVVEASGLRFAVDLCASSGSSVLEVEEGARFLML